VFLHRLDSALCAFGVVRLSASTSCANTGPRWKRNSRFPARRSTPMMSMRQQVAGDRIALAVQRARERMGGGLAGPGCLRSTVAARQRQATKPDLPLAEDDVVEAGDGGVSSAGLDTSRIGLVLSASLAVRSPTAQLLASCVSWPSKSATRARSCSTTSTGAEWQRKGLAVRGPITVLCVSPGVSRGATFQQDVVDQPRERREHGAVDHRDRARRQVDSDATMVTDSVTDRAIVVASAAMASASPARLRRPVLTRE
jgi:hypothetical protein